ncbi:MAG: cytochrome d ubiquinol oxidase subunit II [Akkermansia sp.]
MFESIDLNIVWFILVGVLFSGYAILDGFDLGTGALHLFFKKDLDRRILLNAVGPVWDGNEVWLIVGGGALFAAFPYVYASVFSGFYIAFMLLLLALIMRAVSIEFRSKQPMRWWRNLWDSLFAVGSVLAALLIGVAMGNVVLGIPLDAQGNFTGTLLSLLNPYALLLGVTTVALFAVHGAIFLALKTEGHVQEKVRRLVRPCMLIFILLICIHGVVTAFYVPHVKATLEKSPWIFGLVVLAIIFIACITVFIKKHREGWAFIFSCATMGCLMAMFGATMFGASDVPLMLYAHPVEHSLSIYNSASSRLSLDTMTLIALVGVPIVLSYSAAIYWIFRDKVKLDDSSY